MRVDDDAAETGLVELERGSLVRCRSSARSQERRHEDRGGHCEQPAEAQTIDLLSVHDFLS
jgi:hypothetical protein